MKRTVTITITAEDDSLHAEIAMAVEPETIQDACDANSTAMAMAGYAMRAMTEAASDIGQDVKVEPGPLTVTRKKVQF